MNACKSIADYISAHSKVFYPFDLEYYESIKHYAATSTIFSVCSVEPNNAADVAIIIKIIRQGQVQFAIKGGGHAMNPGFSSTTGIHIAMRRFDTITYHPNNQTVDVGPGLVWDDVYRALAPYNVTVIGGRFSSVGVAGLILGGGYSWKSNQFGLSIDNVFEYELVTPNGTIVYVNNNSYPDIFFGLKGGYNNFGIVTKFNLRAVPQNQVYGGCLYYTRLQIDGVFEAITNFQVKNTDPRAQILSILAIKDGILGMDLVVFYDAPVAPDGIFKEFTDLHPIGILHSRSLLSIVQCTPGFLTDNLRGRFHTVSVTNLSKRVLQQIKNQTLYYSSILGRKRGAIFSYDTMPFLSTYFNRSQGGAYPHIPSSTPLLPICIQFGWESPLDDKDFIHAIQASAETILQTALDDGQDVGGRKQIRYPNYALENTPLSQMYGDNVSRLQRIRTTWDPENVMYLARGFKF